MVVVEGVENGERYPDLRSGRNRPSGDDILPMARRYPLLSGADVGGVGSGTPAAAKEVAASGALVAVLLAAATPAAKVVR